MKPLDTTELQAALTTLPGWAHAADGSGDLLRKTFQLGTFRAAMAFLVRVGFEAEERGHHPEIANVYGTVTITLRTHDAGNRVTKLDVELARAIDGITAAG